MVNRPDDNKTRVDYWLEMLAGVVDDDEQAREMAERKVRMEDERIWAHYRDPRTDLTQMEARDRAQSMDYPNRYNVSQASVSRLISRLDDDMLTERIETVDLGRDVPEELTDREYTVAGLLARHDRDKLKRHGFSDFLDTYRATVARFIVDREALTDFMRAETRTPAWATDRYPDLDPDVGRKFGLREGFVTEDDAAQPHKQTPTPTADD